MSDFLKNRKAKEWQSSNKPRPRQGYRDHVYKGGTGFDRNDRRGERDDRRSAYHKKHHQENLTSVIGKFLPEIKTALERILNNQKEQVKVYERMTAAEEGVNNSLNKIAEALCVLANINPPDIEKIALSTSTEPAQSLEPTISEPDEETTDDVELSSSGKNESTASKDEVLRTIVEMRENGATFEVIALHLDNENIPTFSNRGKWHAQTIHRLYSQNKDSVLNG